MELQTVDSTMVSAVGYDTAMKELEVLFTSGKTYIYYGVSLEIYAGLMTAESKGRYMQENVIDLYSTREKTVP